MDIGNQMRIWHEIRSEALRNDVFSAFLFSNAKNNVFAGHYEPTQLPIRKITNIAQKLKMLGTENPFKGDLEQGGFNCRSGPEGRKILGVFGCVLIDFPSKNSKKTCQTGAKIPKFSRLRRANTKQR